MPGTKAIVLGTVIALTACARMSSPGFPPPARPGFLVPGDFNATFNAVVMMVEARGIPILVADSSFGSIRTDWTSWDEGEVDLATVAHCGFSGDAPPARTRARFQFDVRRRADQTNVTIRTQWQAEIHPGFGEEGAGFVDCRSTGAWERMIEEALTRSGTIR